MIQSLSRVCLLWSGDRNAQRGFIKLHYIVSYLTCQLVLLPLICASACVNLNIMLVCPFSSKRQAAVPSEKPDTEHRCYHRLKNIERLRFPWHVGAKEISFDNRSQAKGYWLIFYQRVMTWAGEDAVALRMKKPKAAGHWPLFQDWPHYQNTHRSSVLLFLPLSLSMSV